MQYGRSPALRYLERAKQFERIWEEVGTAADNEEQRGKSLYINYIMNFVE